MSGTSNFENKDFLRLNAAHLFVLGDEAQRSNTIEVLAQAGLHPERHNVKAVRIEKIGDLETAVEGEFVAIADLGLTEEVEAKAQRCMQELGIDQANTQLIWANSSLQIFNIKGN